MTYKERYRPPKYGDRADAGAIMDTGDPYQNLANGIVAQSAADYMAAYRYALEHPQPRKQEEFLTPEQIATLNEPRTQSKYEKLKIYRLRRAYKAEEHWNVAYRIYWTMERQKRVRASEEYRAYTAAERTWVNAIEMLDDCRDFFCGDWIKMLTRLNGPELMNQIEKVVREELKNEPGS